MKQILLLILFAGILRSASSQGWSTTGNTGTTPPANFIGTKDSAAFMIKVFNKKAAYIDVANSLANTSFGNQALLNNTGNNNSAFGFKSLDKNTNGNSNSAFGQFSLFSNTTGYSNVAVGVRALYSNTVGNNLIAVGDSALYRNDAGLFTGSYNTAIGSKAMFSNKTGFQNTAIGYQTLYSNVSGYDNIAIGRESLHENKTGNSNCALGDYALFNNTKGNSNTAIGNYSLRLNTTGTGNTTNGYLTLGNNTTGSYNVATGYQALYTNTIGDYNVATGYQALYNDTIGIHNIATGYQALYSNTIGIHNIATGYLALYELGLYSPLASPSYNIAIGDQAAYHLREGDANIAIGDEAAYGGYGGIYNIAIGFNAAWSSQGNSNVAIGDHALYFDGEKNTAIGSFAGYSDVARLNASECTFLGYLSAGAISDIHNSTALGSSSKVTQDNMVRIGNTTITSIGGYVNWSNVSDIRYKKNIRDNVPGLTFINKLKPITYTLDVTGLDNFLHKKSSTEQADKNTKTIKEKALKEKEQIIYTGFIAQDVEKAAKEMNYDFSGVDAPKNENSLYGLRYAEFVVPLVKAVQELSQQNDSLKSQNYIQQKINADLQNQINDLRAMIVSNQSTINTQLSTASLNQNIPNPFNHSTTINYSLPQTYSSAKIIVSDKGGKPLKQINISGKTGSVNIDASTLASGAYQYSLYVDGRLIDIKQMVLAK